MKTTIIPGDPQRDKAMEIMRAGRALVEESAGVTLVSLGGTGTLVNKTLTAIDIGTAGQILRCGADGQFHWEDPAQGPYKRLNCRNCGAPWEPHECSYCRTATP